MGHKPLQECRYRTNNCTCTHPEMGVVKLLWWNLGNRQCFLVNQSKSLTCSAAEPIPNKPLPPPAPPKKRTGNNLDPTIPVDNVPEMPPVKPPKTDGNVPVFKYPCKHRNALGVCSKLNLTATHGTNICTETKDALNTLYECSYHDNYKGYTPSNTVIHPAQMEPLKESDIFRIKIPEEVLSSTVIQSPAITPITADPDVIKPNGSYSCNNKPCGLGKSHDAFYGCPTCGIRIFVKNTHSGGSM
jgi:DNA-directed RNA polymerase subunit RPC12/RpoP